MGVIRPKLIMKSICSCGYGWSVISFRPSHLSLVKLKENKTQKKNPEKRISSSSYTAGEPRHGFRAQDRRE